MLMEDCQGIMSATHRNNQLLLGSLIDVIYISLCTVHTVLLYSSCLLGFKVSRGSLVSRTGIEIEFIS